MANTQTEHEQTQELKGRLHRVRQLMDALPQHTIYAIVDAAADEQLYGWLQLEPKESQVTCVYDGDPAIRYARYAPYLMVLHSSSPLFWRWTEQGMDRNWGIWCASGSDVIHIKRHFKRFLTLVHEGKTAYLRYYDPRVLPTLLPSMTPGHCYDFFGGDLIHSYGAVKAQKAQLWVATTEQEGWIQKAANAGKLVNQVRNIYG